MTTPGKAVIILPLLFCLTLPTPFLSHVYSPMKRELPETAMRCPAGAKELVFVPRLGVQRRSLYPGAPSQSVSSQGHQIPQ